MILNMGLDNKVLYDGCDISEVAGRFNLTTPPTQALNIIGRNVAAMVQAVPPNEKGVVVLTGAAPVWTYLVCFHSVVHSFRQVEYHDGRGNELVVAAHG